MSVTSDKAERTSRRHRVRQVRARIVTLAQEYREACRQHGEIREEVGVYVLRLDQEAPGLLLDAGLRTWEGREQRRRALWAALDELEMLEGRAG